jgi:YidC/Oxa1 family membrane protein insertase
MLLRAGLIALYERVGNWGWAIVLLTLVINLLLVPLKHYSFVSMRKMQKLAPQIQRIKDRYKKVKPTDPRYQQMNQEIMGLYKEHKVNPVSGCLPMLLMIPFFFAFYRLLMASIELRQAPFLLWIHDLSQFDPYFVLPILMGASQLVIQHMTPQTTVDPVQAKILKLMPIMFTFILAWAPAGLVLYWFSNNIVSMVQQILTNKWLSRGDGEDGQRGAKAEKKKAAKQAQAHA